MFFFLFSVRDKIEKERVRETYSPGDALFENCRRKTRGDCGAVGGALTSNLRLNIGDPTMALFCLVSWTFGDVPLD